MQTILGAGGAIGIGLAQHLTAYSTQIRLVSRNPKKVNPADQLFPADLTQRDQVFRALEGSQVVYLTIGLPYSTKIWQELWPLLMKNVLDACEEHRCRLVFFDNVYALGGDDVRHITETSPLCPVSHKGLVRASLDRMVMDRVDRGRMLAIIARSPDFFGPLKANSALMAMVYDNLAKKQKALWFCDARVPHSMGYTPELTRAVARLGNTSSAFNQIWNLPTAAPATGEEWVRLFAGALGVEPGMHVLPKWGVRLLGLFVPILREMHEMLYQYDRPYVFDSSKYERTFNHTPLGNQEAVRETVAALQDAGKGKT